MKKFILLTCVFLLLIGIFLSARKSKPLITDEVHINMPEDNTVNGYRNKGLFSSYPDIIDENDVTVGDVTAKTTETAYCANKNSKVFHKSECSSVSTIKSENCVYFKTRESCINNGYSPCKKCNP